MGKIFLNGLKFHAYHGCFEEEAKTGTTFMVDLEFEFETAKAAKSDNLFDTIDYQKVYLMIAEEMKKRSNLVEHVARRILFRLTEKFEGVTVARIRIKKINPPLGGDIVGSVGVEMTSDEL